MRSATKIFLASLIAVFMSVPLWAAASPAQTVNLPPISAGYAIDDEDQPEVTARVARISYLGGEAKIRRAGLDDWEVATLNLPLVEGDEIVTDAGGRVEIQFDKSTHLRLSENAYLKLITLKDEAVAVSLSLGSMNLRLRSFDREISSFEIDAPKTTVAIQKSGSYRIDAGRDGDNEIRIAAREGGEARIFSDTSAFTLKNGRSARVFINGQNSGEWNLADASRYQDDFDEWTSDRDSVIASQLKDAHYDTYYDSDLYGADDLSGHGDWVFINTYGYVWRPYRTTIGRYDNWSPYRYGHWRWMPPYGWIWVNDEPWGWATYHHGRWFHHAGQWHWSPYGYYRPRRSWWFPALVVINVFNNNTCWYPLSYRHRYRSYNAHHVRNGGPRGNGNGGGVTGPVVVPRDPTDLGGRGEMPGEFETDVPISAVVAVRNNQFGQKTGPAGVAPRDIARMALTKKNSDAPILPSYKDAGRRGADDIRAEKPRLADTGRIAKVGVGVRKSDTPMETELRTKTLGDRPPRRDIATPDTKPVDGRKTGAFDRPPVEVREPRYTPPVVKEPVRTTPQYTPPVVKEPVRTERPKDPVEPRYRPPVREQPVEKPRSYPPAVKPTRVERPPAKATPKPAEKKPEPPPAKNDTGSRKKDKPDS